MGAGSMVTAAVFVIASAGTIGASHETVPPVESQQRQVLETLTKSPLFYVSRDAFITDISHFASMSRSYGSGTGVGDWGSVLEEIQSHPRTVWDSRKLKELLSQPLGAPIDLTKEEAEEIVRLAAGRRHDLPSGADFTRRVREQLGHSLMERVKKAKR